MGQLGIVITAKELTILEEMTCKQLYTIHRRKPYSEAVKVQWDTEKRAINYTRRLGEVLTGDITFLAAP